jgi:tRNA-2-methylthio-N6-dimethylallyladenosine synthase
VGFCGESDADFEGTLDLIERVRFDSMFAFCYSERPGTHAARALDDDVSVEVKKARLEKVLDLQRAIQRENNERQVESLQRVLVLKEDGEKRGRLTGRAGDNRLVHFAGHTDLIGDIVPVRITSASIHSLQGELEEEGNVRE